MTAGELIRNVRKRRGLTQADLARLAGTSQPVISAYEHDMRDPGLATLRKLVEAAGERLQVAAVPWGTDLPPSLDLEDHGRRLLDVLSLVDAIPLRPRSRTLNAPRLISR